MAFTTLAKTPLIVFVILWYTRKLIVRTYISFKWHTFIFYCYTIIIMGAPLKVRSEYFACEIHKTLWVFEVKIILEEICIFFYNVYLYSVFLHNILFYFQGIVTLSSIVAFLINLTIYWIIGNTSPVTYPSLWLVYLITTFSYKIFSVMYYDFIFCFVLVLVSWVCFCSAPCSSSSYATHSNRENCQSLLWMSWFLHVIKCFCDL